MDTLHPWDVTPAEARVLQEQLAGRVVRRDETQGVRWIAGADVHYPQRGQARAAAVLFRYPELTLEAASVVEEEVKFPYLPGLLSFREAAAVAHALEGLPRRPELLLVDGQGIAHPRRFGLAAHLGVLLDMPAVGCAKSRLIGAHEEPSPEAGAWTPLMDGQEVIGAVVRTRKGVKPLFVSVGHRVDLEAVIRWVLACCRGFRLPEPCRWAHRAAGGADLTGRAADVRGRRA
ncbi:MAG: deoxyribonuclease V [Chloroflexi bacterium]|nr:deoxyribonuclease V [Chloroflexota bacterium]